MIIVVIMQYTVRLISTRINLENYPFKKLMLVPRKSEELRIKEQGMRQWQANVRRDPPGYESNP